MSDEQPTPEGATAPPTPPTPLPTSEVFAHSPSVAKLAGALAQAQSDFGTLKATSTADAEKYTYNYADLASVLAAVRPALGKAGIAILQGVAMNRPASGGGGMVVLVETRLVHQSGEWVATTLKLPTPETAPQKVGALVSYLRRYGLLALTACAAEDNDAADTEPQAPRRSSPQRPPAASQRPSGVVTMPAVYPTPVAPPPAPEPHPADRLGPSELPPEPEAKAKPARKAKAEPPAAAAKQAPVGGPGSISAAERGLLFRTAREQSLTEAQVKALIQVLFGYTSTSQILAGVQFHKVINAMENPGDHGVTFAEGTAIYSRHDDSNALPEGA
jgi:hypothetical protein